MVAQGKSEFINADTLIERDNIKRENIPGHRLTRKLLDDPALRSIDDAVVDQLKESILNNGLQQPIGLARYDSPRGLRLIWGAHRLKAILDLNDEYRLTSSRAFSLHCSQIPAVVYKNPTDRQVEMLRLTENAIRNELSIEERDIARTRLLALVKEAGGNIQQSVGNSNARGRPESDEARTAKLLGINDNGKNPGQAVRRSKDRVKAAAGMADAKDTPGRLREAAAKAEKMKALPKDHPPKERPEDSVPVSLDGPIYALLDAMKKLGFDNDLNGSHDKFVNKIRKVCAEFLKGSRAH